MIGWLQGQLADRWQQNNRCGLLLVCGGVGYEVQVVRRHWDQLDGNGASLTLHVHQVIREDSWTLYGFAQRQERELFRELVAVSGVGPQMALGLLGELKAEELVRAIVQADLRLLCRAPGVGKRTAERLSVELRSRLQERYGTALQLADADDLITDTSHGGSASTPQGGMREELQLTLTALGYEALEINRALRAVASQSDLDSTDAEAWLRESLRWLAREVA